MATTKSFTIGGAWVRVASGRGGGSLVRMDADGPFRFCITVGSATTPPELEVSEGHPATGSASFPIVAAQHVWAAASSTARLTVT